MGSRQSQKTSVVMYSPYPRGGHPKYTRELCEAVVQAVPGRNVDLHLVSSVDLDPSYSSNASYPVHRILPALPTRSGSMLKYLLRRAFHLVLRELRILRFVFLRKEVKVVHFQEMHLLTAWLMFPLIRSMGCSIVATVHNVLPHAVHPSAAPIVKFLLRRAYASADELLVHTEKNKSSCERFVNSGREVTRVTTTPHGLWNRSGGAVEKTSFESHLSTNRGLLFFGAIRENKGLHLLLEAALQGKLEGHTLTIAGVPLEEKYYEHVVVPLLEQVRAGGIRVDIKPEFVAEEDVQELICCHRAMILPYLATFQAQSGAALLALANYVPIVATSAGGLEDLLALDAVTLIRSESAAAVAESIVEFDRRAEDQQWIAAAHASIERLRGECSWNSMALRTLAVYERLGLNRSRAREDGFV